MRTSRSRVTTTFIVLTLWLGVLVPIADAGNARHNAGTINRSRTAPKIIVPFTSFSFGDVYRGEVISQIFVIRNDGDADLQIKDFKGDCGCTVSRTDRVIPPGKQGSAELEVQTVSQSGLINKTATLHSNDPERPSIVFTLIANVIAGASLRQGKRIGPLFVSPGSQMAMYALPGRKAMTEVSVTADTAQVKVLRVEGGTKNFVSRVEVVESGRTYKIVVESTLIETGGLYTDQLRVVTDSPALPEFTLDVALRVYDKQ